MKPIRSTDFFKPHWLCWLLLGSTVDKVNFKVPYMLYAIVVNLMVTICYPLHLCLALFSNETQAENFKCLAASVTCVACSIKFLMYARRLRKVYRIEQILMALDDRVECWEDRQYFQRIRKQVRNIVYAFYSIFIPIGFIAELSFLFSPERRLLYPAYFPFDWRNSAWKFWLANVYQFVGITYHLLQNFADDSFPPMAMCLLSGHVQLLGRRAARIGYDGRDDQQKNEQELLLCIKDQNNLYELFDCIQEIVSLPLLLQFSVSICNICVAIAALLFYVDTPLDFAYYTTYLLAMPLQIFPTCYYGSDFQHSFGQLHHFMYSSNWMQQSRSYKKKMMLFIERSLRQTTGMAGGMLRIHLDTFFVICKGAYSLFAVITRTRN